MIHHYLKSSKTERNFRMTKDYQSVHKKLIKIFSFAYGVAIDESSRKIHDGEDDKESNISGVDVSYLGTVLSSKKKTLVKIDEKFRFKAYDDILLETISNDRTEKVGWALDESKQNDLVLYVIVPKKIAFLWLQRRMLEALKSGTIQRSRPFSAKNRGYNTISVAISESDVLKQKGQKFSYE